MASIINIVSCRFPYGIDIIIIIKSFHVMLFTQTNSQCVKLMRMIVSFISEYVSKLSQAIQQKGIQQQSTIRWFIQHLPPVVVVQRCCWCCYCYCWNPSPSPSPSPWQYNTTNSLFSPTVIENMANSLRYIHMCTVCYDNVLW